MAVQKLAECLKLQIDEKLNTEVKIIEIGKLEEYTTSTNNKRQYFNIKVADETSLCSIRVYQKRKINEFKEGKSYR